MLETRNMITEMKNAFKGIASRLKEKTGEFEDRSMPISQTRMQRERKKIQENIKKNCGTIFKSVANITGCQKDKKETGPEDEFEGKIATTFQRRRKLREPHAERSQSKRATRESTSYSNYSKAKPSEKPACAEVLS